MGLKSFGALLCLAALVSGVPASAQWTVDPPGSRQPVAPQKPRIAPVLEAQWNDVQKQLVARHVVGGRPDNGVRTLLNLPELLDAVMPYTNYLTNGSSLMGRPRANGQERRDIAGGIPAHCPGTRRTRLGSGRSEPASTGGSALQEFVG